MRRIPVLLAVAAVAALTAGVAAPASAAPVLDSDRVVMTPELEERIQARIEEFQAKFDAPGVSVAVVTPSAEGAEPVVTQFTVGTPELGSGAPVESTTQFEIGSETKVFTANLLTYLLAEGRVSLDDPVQEYAPDGITVPVWTDPDTGETTEITLRDLATHQAALPDLPENYYDPCQGDPSCDNPRPGYTPAFLWAGLSDTTLRWQPGTNWLYSNFGFGILGTILATVIDPQPETDPPAYESALQGAFLQDLGMSATLLGTGAHLAAPYTAENEPAEYYYDTNAMAGEGGLVSNTDDMAKWLTAHLGYIPDDAPLGVRTMADTLEPVSTITTICSEPFTCEPTTDFQMGLAWQLYPASVNNMGADWAFKNGGTLGFSSDTALAPSKGVGVTTMWNQRRELNGEEPGVALLSLILNFEPTPTPTHHDGGGGHEEPPQLAESGFDAAALGIATIVAATSVAAGSILVRRRRRTAG